MQQIVVRIPPAQKAFLDQLAQKQDTTVSDLTRQALGEFIADHKQQSSNIFLELAQIGKRKKNVNAPKDLSSTYKKYVYNK